MSTRGRAAGDVSRSLLLWMYGAGVLIVSGGG